MIHSQFRLAFACAGWEQVGKARKGWKSQKDKKDFKDTDFYSILWVKGWCVGVSFFLFLVFNVYTCYVHSFDSLEYISHKHTHTHPPTPTGQTHKSKYTKKTYTQHKIKIQHDVCHIKWYTLCVVLGDCSWLSELGRW